MGSGPLKWGFMMNFKSLLLPLLGSQLGWSAITLTFQDPKMAPIEGVSCAQAGGTPVLSNAQGVAILSGVSSILPVNQGRSNSPLFNIPLNAGEKATLTIFDSKGQKVSTRDIRLGDQYNFDKASPGVYHIRISSKSLTVSQSVVSMGTEMRFTGASVDESVSASALRKSSAALGITCEKAGYATKVYEFTDGDTKTVGFGVPISRPFKRGDYPLYPGFNLEVAEDFTTASWPAGLTWDAAYKSNDVVWEPSDGGFGGNRVRFHPGNLIFKDDALFLRIEKTPQPASFSYSEGQNCEADGVTKNLAFCTAGNPNGGAKFAPPSEFKGAELRTKNNHFRFGRYEVNIDPPNRGPGPGTANGFIAAMFTWFTPRDLHWRENDIEILGDKTNTYLTNIFFTNKNPAWEASIESSNFNTAPPPPTAFDPRTAHTYAFEWLPKSVKWYVDGILVRTYGEGGTNKAGVEISQLSTKVLFNFWLMAGGPVGGLGNANEYPIEAKFDFFRYYRWDQDGDKKTYPEVPCLNKFSQGCDKL